MVMTSLPTQPGSDAAQPVVELIERGVLRWPALRPLVDCLQYVRMVTHKRKLAWPETPVNTSPPTPATQHPPTIRLNQAGVAQS